MSDDLDTPNGGKPQKKSSKVVDTLTNLTVAPGSPRETNGSHRVRRTSREVALRSSTAPTTRSEEPSARALTTTRALTLAAAVTAAFMLVVELKALAAAAATSTGSTTRVAQQRAATPIDDSVLLASGALPSPLACARHGTVRHAHSEVTATGPTRPPHDRLSPPTCLCAPQI